jgi:hypothetical protein
MLILGGGGGGPQLNYLMPKFHQIMLLLVYKGNKGEIYIYIIKKIIMLLQYFFQNCVINHLY